MTIRSVSHSYEVARVGLDALKAEVSPDSFWITDTEVASRYGCLLSAERSLVLPSGESTKCLEVFGHCLSWLASAGATRRSRIVALGGGVIGDLVGFVAAAYMRGVSYTQIPTTLLAQVDSSVGGKVGVDLPEGKNLAGASHPPAKVFVVEEFLETLPRRQLLNGLAEVVKYGFISDVAILDQVASPSLDWKQIVDRCIAIKARIVQEDEFETTGLRATLNFGHTIGHAIEFQLGYRDLLHGEAISIGMVLEARLGEEMGVSEPGAAAEVEQTLLHLGLPTTHPVLADRDALIGAMRRDKKALDGSLSFSLLTRLGECKLVAGVPDDLVRSVLVG